jgi:hypothetical protein
LMHLDSHGATCCDWAFACHALCTAGVTTYVVGANALHHKKAKSV